MKNDLTYIEHINECIDKIKRFTSQLTLENFNNNEMVQDAVIRNIEIIGEAAKQISHQFREQYADIPWKEITGMRDKLIHDYMGVDTEIVWNTIRTDIPLLEELFQKNELK
jgi:uncharacterized protein with HEPN domain